MKTALVRILAVVLLSRMLYAQNGIDVGRAKAFDNRALTIMLEKLNAQLVQLQVVDQKSLASALGTLQGFSSQETNTSLSVQAATPGNKIAPTGGDSLPASTFTVPGDVKYGLNAGDLLTDQVNLTYQIFNIQMILDRSVSDRLKSKEPRLQVVLGFDVTLDPPREAVDSAAIVDVAVKMDKSTEPVSVVALMPQEHTYNAAAISTKSSAFGGSAVTQIATVAYSSRKRAQTYYLYRDADTVAFAKSLKDASADPQVHFGWQFRPVLGRRSVSPGSRQMFAVLALPATDRPTDFSEQILHITVTTHWRKYNRSTLTSTEAKTTPWWKMARYSLGLGIPSVYPPAGFGGGKPYDLPVLTTALIQKNLSPKVEHVSWSLVGSKQLLVSVAGENFFNDTQVGVGGKLLSGPVLQIKSSQALDLIVEPADPFSGVVMGRYGPAVPLVNPGRMKAPPLQLDISDVRPSAVIGGYAALNVFLTRKEGGDLKLADLPQSHGAPARLLEPIFTFNGAVIPGPWSYKDIAARTEPIPGSTNVYQFPAMVLATGSISADALKPGEGMFKVTYPFSDIGLRASFRLNDPNKLIEAQRLGDSILLFNKISQALPWNLWTAILPGNKVQPAVLCPDPAQNPPAAAPVFCYRDQYAFLTPPDKADPGDTLVLYESKAKGTYLVSVPAKAGAPAPAPKPVPTVNQYDSRWVALDAPAVKAFAKAQIDGKDVAVNKQPNDSTDAKAPPYKKVEIYVTRIFSEKPGSLDVNLLDDKGNIVDHTPIVIACTNCQGTPDTKETKK